MEVFSMVVALLSGVAMFLYGMMLMGDALKLVAGNKLEAFLYKMTNTPLKGVALGAGVTCVIQSSSATTVMVIGFVNSMMMKLRQAIGQCHRVMAGMAKKVRKNVNRALNLLNDFQPDKYEKVQRKEDLIDKYETKLGMYLMKLTKKEMTSSQTRHVSLYLSTISDFERIGDHAAGIAHMSSEMHEQHTGFSGAAWWSR